MTTATIAKPAATPAKPAKVAPPTADELAKISATLRDRWTVADAAETKARDLFEAADMAWQNTRVIKVRVAYAAAMVSPVKGNTNLLNACRILFADVDASPAVRTKQATAKKMTLRHYVDAGAALFEAGLAYSIKEPTAEERTIVAAVFREGNKRDKAEAKGPEAPSADGEETSKPAKVADPSDPATLADVIAAMENLQNVVKGFTRECGFPANVAENLAEVLAEIGTSIDSHRVDGGDAS